MKHLALLRGINVGGKNLIKMTDLKAAFEEMGYAGVKTYIQSGNVLFETSPGKREKLARRIETGLSKRFCYASRAAVVSQTELSVAVRSAPRGFGTDSQKYRYDVIFLLPPLSPTDAAKEFPWKEGVDHVSLGKTVLYFSRLIAKASQSRLARITSKPIYQHMTIRNWNTTTRLLRMMEEPR